MPAACLVAITRELALVEGLGLGWGWGRESACGQMLSLVGRSRAN